MARKESASWPASKLDVLERDCFLLVRGSGGCRAAAVFDSNTAQQLRWRERWRVRRGLSGGWGLKASTFLGPARAVVEGLANVTGGAVQLIPPPPRLLVESGGRGTTWPPLLPLPPGTLLVLVARAGTLLSVSPCLLLVPLLLLPNSASVVSPSPSSQHTSRPSISPSTCSLRAFERQSRDPPTPSQ